MEAERALVDDFLRLFYDSDAATWNDTRWLGVPVLKTPVDLWSIQEIVIETRPDLIIESGVAQGGSTLFFASLLDTIGAGEVIGIDSDLAPVDSSVREHPRITLIEGDSADASVVAQLHAAAEGKRRVMVDLDSDHHAPNVTRELSALSGLVSPGCYLIVEDGVLNGHPVDPGFGAGPTEALQSFLAADPPFDADPARERRLLTFNPGGYLRRRGDLDVELDRVENGAASNGAGERVAASALEVEGLKASVAERQAEIESLRRALIVASTRVNELSAAYEPLMERLRLQSGWIAELEPRAGDAEKIARELAAEQRRAAVLQAELEATALRLERLHARASMRVLAAVQRIPPLSWLQARRARSYHRQLGERRGAS